MKKELDIGWIDSWQLRDRKDVHPSHAVEVVLVEDILLMIDKIGEMLGVTGGWQILFRQSITESRSKEEKE